MDICRTCLSNKATKDLLQLRTDDSEDNKNYLEIMLYCLDIEVSIDSKVSTKLCFKCYKKILLFYEFKKTALKSDTYLKSLVNSVEDRENEICVSDDIKLENESVSSEDILNDSTDEVEIKIEQKEEEIDVLSDEELLSVIKFAKYENIENSKENGKIKFERKEKKNDVLSDDELLSVIKFAKHENIEKSKENAPIKKKRGRSKKIVEEKIMEKTYQVCDECGKTVRNLKEHSLLHRPVCERKRFKCKMCDKLFSSYSARLRHLKVKHLGIKKRCHICNKEVSALKAHQLRVHENEKLRHVCLECDRRFVSKSALDLHMTAHTKVRAYECDLCNKTFRAKINLMMHKRQVHDKEKTHMCQFCSKSFFKKYHLQVHIRAHTKEKPYKCSECGKYFSTTTILKKHILIHGEKQFDCTLCDMSFASPAYLRVHMISHTKEKKHPCQFCGVKFGRQDHRKRHERTAHGAHQNTLA